MNKQERYDIFLPELELLSSDAQGMALWLLSKAPDYFFHIPASSTGKYHPAFAQGEGGLIRHTKAAINIAVKLWPLLVEAEPNAAAFEDDVILALMFHDVLKKGLSCTEHTQPYHAEESAQWVLDTILHIPENDMPNSHLVQVTTDLMRTHMGQWGHTPWDTEMALMTTLQHFVHRCDCISSQNSFMNKMCNVELFGSLQPEPVVVLPVDPAC